MRATEFIRGLLDLIDQVDDTKSSIVNPQPNDYEDEVSVEPDEDTQYSNSPDVIHTSLEIIDNMGNDVNGPVRPDQVKTATFPMFFGMK